MDSKPTSPPPYDQSGGHGYSSPPQSPPTTVQPTVLSTNVTVVSGRLAGCPVCHNNSWTGTYSCCAWLLAICCFPCGIICCCCLRKKKCTKCGFTAA